MRFVAALLRHETNTFSPLPTPLAAFNPVYGAAAIAAYQGTNNPLAAYLDLAREVEADIIVPLAADAHPSGRVTDEAFESMTTTLLDALQHGCDALLLDLHGAMVTESFDDGEGELLRRIRAAVPGLPIAVALDFHANLSGAMIDNATVVTGYRTYPHTDMYETGQRAGRTLLKALRGEAHPVMSWDSRPMLTHTLRQTPAEQPMKDIMDRVIGAEAARTVLNASVFGGFPLADIPHAALSAVVISDGNQAAAEGYCEDLLDMAWERRKDFVFVGEPLAASIAKAKSFSDGPVILVDHGDNCASGGTQDVMTVLAEVIRQGLTHVVAGPFWDPAAVAQAIDAGIGQQVTLALGGKTAMPAIHLPGQPLDITATVRTITDGQFRITAPMLTGTLANLGRTVVLETGTLEILVSEQRFEPFDLGVFTHAGIDPASRHYVLLKSRQHFRAGFEAIARHIVLVAGPGVCSSDYSLFPFQHLRRPIYPLD